MRRSLLALACGGLAFALTGCAGFLSAPVVPPVAFVLTDYQAPLDTDLEATQKGSKRGTASVQNVLGIASWGDASVAAAAANGGLGVIRHADYQFFNVLGLYSRYTTVVYGD